MSINIEREFYIPETFDIQRRFRQEYNYKTHEYTTLDTYTNDYYTQYVNQKGSRVYYLDDENVACTDTYTNIPMSGFTIDRNTYAEADYRQMVDGVIIKDPRGFEFKISIRNFLHLTRHHVIDCGEIMAECVLTWSVNGYLTLLSTESDSYKSAVEYTAKQHAVFDVQNLEIGASYLIKKSSDEFVYLGKHKINSSSDNYYLPFNAKASKQLRPVFYNKSTDEFVTFMLGKNLAGFANDSVQDTSELLKRFKNTKAGRTFSHFEFEDFTEDHITVNGRGLYEGIAGCINEQGNYVHLRYFSAGTWDVKKENIINLSPNIYMMEDGQMTGSFIDYYDSRNTLNLPREVLKEHFMKFIKQYNLKIATAHFEDELSDSIRLCKENEDD